MAILKNIILDLGGVLLNIDYNKTTAAFTHLGVKDFKLMYDQFSADDLFENLEKGFIAEKDFYKAMIERDKTLTIESITDSWNAMLLDFRTESLKFLEELAKKYNLFLLSNTNVIHKKSFDSLFTRETGKARIDDYFNKVYYSHLIGLRKPDVEIFEFVLKDAGIRAGETLFIDDSFNNIAAARALGIKTHLLLASERIEDVDLSI